MEKSVAQAILGLPPQYSSVELTEAFELKLFEFKHFFLTQYVRPKVWKIKLKKLKKLGHAYELLGKDLGVNPKTLSLKTGFSPTDDFLSFYSQKQSEIKLGISQASSVEQLYAHAKSRVELEFIYAQWYIHIIAMKGLHLEQKQQTNMANSIPWNLLLKLRNKSNEFNREETEQILGEWSRVKTIISDQKDW